MTNAFPRLGALAPTVLLAASLSLLALSPAAGEGLGPVNDGVQDDSGDYWFRHDDLGENQPVFFEGAHERINYFNGNVHHVFTDLHLPGKNGLDLKVQRTYTSKIWGRVDYIVNQTEAFVAAKELNELGYGWSLHFGRLRLVQGDWSNHYYMFEESDGTTHRFYADYNQDFVVLPDPNDHAYVSEDLWLLLDEGESDLCPSGSGADKCVISPRGIRYELAADAYLYGGSSAHPITPVSAIEDPYENRIEIVYDVTHDGIVDYVDDTYDRRIYFDYEEMGSMTGIYKYTGFNVFGVTGSDYSYAYTELTGDSLLGDTYYLTSVSPPAGPGWEYDYHIGTSTCAEYTGSGPCQNNGALTTVTSPTGGKVEYFFEDRAFHTGEWNTSGDPLLVFFSVVVRKEVFDRDSSSHDHLWQYAYNSQAYSAGYPGDTTTVTRPDGLKDKYLYHSFGSLNCQGNDDDVWLAGRPKEFKFAIDGDSDPLETRTWNWIESTNAFAQYMLGPYYNNGGYCFQGDIKFPLLDTYTVTRGDVTYTTSYDTFDAYNTAQDVYQSSDNVNGNLTRSVEVVPWYPNASSSGKISGIAPYFVGYEEEHNETAGGVTVDRGYEYSDYGSLTLETLEGLTRMVYEHDATTGDLVKQTDGDGVWVGLGSYTYGRAGQLSRAKATGSGSCVVDRDISWRGQVESFEPQASCGSIVGDSFYYYDDSGRRTKTSKPGWTDETYTYSVDSNGYLTGVLLDRGTFGSTDYLDGFGQVTRTADSENVNVQQFYDGMGRITFQSYPYDGTATVYGDEIEFDGLGRVTRVEHSDSKSLTRVFEEDYESVKDEEGNETKYYFQTRGGPEHRVLWKVDPPGADNNTLYYYNNYGALTYSTQENSSVPYTVNRYLYYNPRGQLTGEVHPESGTTTYVVTTMGRVTKRTNGAGASVCYDWDLSAGLVTDFMPECSASPTNDDTEYLYDPYGILTTRSSTNGGAYSYAYDGGPRLTSVTHVLGGFTRTTGYVFDGATGVVSQMTYPSGLVLDYEFDTQGRVTKLTGDSGGTPPVSHGVIHGVTYEASQPKSITWGSSTTTEATSTYTYDTRRRMVGVHHQDDTPATIANVQLQVDGVGNVTTYARESDSRSLEYDPLNRLTKATFSDYTYSYTYDEVGNVKSFKKDDGGTPVTKNYVYGSSNRLWKRYNGETLETTLLYDNAGQLTSKGSRSYGWSPAGWLNGTGAPEENYKYESGGLRVKKAVASEDPVYYEYDLADRVLHELVDASPDDIEYDYLYLFGRNIGRVTDTTSLSLSFSDHLGSVLATHTVGGSTCSADYEPFGLEKVGNECSSLQYNGRVQDGSGLLYYNARYYDPEIGRFVSADSVIGSLGNPQSLNKYAYGLNNPYRYVDPDGRNAVVSRLLQFIARSSAVSEAGAAVLGTIGIAGAVYKTSQTVSEIPATEVASFPMVDMSNVDVSTITMSEDAGSEPDEAEDGKAKVHGGKDAGKSSRHGDSGRALKKIEDRLKKLEDEIEALKKAVGKKGRAKEMQKKKETMKNLKEDAKRKEKGTEHWN